MHFSPQWLFVIFQKFAIYEVSVSYSLVDRIQNSHGTLHAVEGWRKVVLYVHFMGDVEWILVGDPTCINWCHEYFVLRELLRTSSCDHV